MRKIRNKSRIAKSMGVCLMLLSCAAMASEPVIYIVQKGDTVSTIAQTHIGSPVFTRDGSLTRILKLNRWLRKDFLIYPGQPVIIGETTPLAAIAERREPSRAPAQAEPVETTAQPPVKETPLKKEPVTSEIAKTPEEEPELGFRINFGYGGSYVGIKQAGAFGGIEGSVISTNAMSIQTRLSYEEWRLSVGMESSSVSLASDTTNARSKETKEFKTFSLKPGYGIFFLGVKAQTSPLMRASGTTLEWSDATTLSGLAGIRLEKIYAGRRKKPFLLGMELEGSYPLSTSGNGGPQLRSTSGFGAEAKGYAEKALLLKEDFRLNLGLEASAVYEKNNFSGSWSGSTGDASTTVQNYGSKLYLGLEF